MKKQFVVCYQQIEGGPKPPFKAQLIKDSPPTGRCTIRVGKANHMVNRGVCSTQITEK